MTTDTKIEVTLEQTSIVLGKMVLVTATITDTNNNPLPNLTINFNDNGANGDFYLKRTIDNSQIAYDVQNYNTTDSNGKTILYYKGKADDYLASHITERITINATFNGNTTYTTSTSPNATLTVTQNNPDISKRVINKYNDRCYKLKITSPGNYLLRIPSAKEKYFKKTFSGSKVSYGMKAYSNKNGVKITPSIRCYDSEKTNLHMYYVGTDTGGNSVLDCNMNELNNEHNTLLDILTGSTDPKTTYKIYRGNWFEVKLKNYANIPLPNQYVNITVNGKTYTELTNADGIAKLQINLSKGKYSIVCEYKGGKIGDITYNSYTTDTYYFNCVTTHLTILKVVNPSFDENGSNKLTKGSCYRVHLSDGLGNYLIDQEVIIKVNGKSYTEKTLSDGTARLPIQLNVGTYEITATYGGNGHYQGTTTTETIVVEAHKEVNMTISNKNASKCGQFAVRLFDIYNNPIENRQITFKVNNKTYTKSTNPGGWAILPINLNPGTYKLDYSFAGDTYYNAASGSDSGMIVSSPVNTKFRLYYNPIVRGTNLYVKLLTENDEFIGNETIGITVNDKTYNVTTSSVGLATLPINLYPKDYEFTFTYAGNEVFYKSQEKYTITVINKDVENDPLNSEREVSNLQCTANLPTEINDKCSYLEFVFRLSVPEPCSPTDPTYIYANNFIVNEGIKIPYIRSSEEVTGIPFYNSYYAILYPYKDMDKGVQVIRPLKNNMTTKSLSVSVETILAPFDYPDIKEDRANSIVKEYLNFYDQTINISRD